MSSPEPPLPTVVPGEVIHLLKGLQLHEAIRRYGLDGNQFGTSAIWGTKGKVATIGAYDIYEAHV